MPIVWAWKLEEGLLCQWSEPEMGRLLRRGKPSTHAEPTKCFLIKYSDYIKLKNAVRKGGKDG